MACLWVFSMGSKSNSTDQTTTTQTAINVSRDAMTESGTQILDSIIVDPSDETMKQLIASLNANFEVLMSGSKVGMQQVIDLGKDVLDLTDKNQIQMAGMAQASLRQSLDWMQEQQAAGKYVIDFASSAVDQSYDFSGKALEQSADALKRALDITADVKTGDFNDTLKSISTIVMIFALGAIYLARK